MAGCLLRVAVTVTTAAETCSPRQAETNSLQRSAGESCKEQDSSGESRAVREISRYGKAASPACSGESLPSYYPRSLLPSILEGDREKKKSLMQPSCCSWPFRSPSYHPGERARGQT